MIFCLFLSCFSITSRFCCCPVTFFLTLHDFCLFPSCFYITPLFCSCPVKFSCHFMIIVFSHFFPSSILSAKMFFLLQMNVTDLVLLRSIILYISPWFISLLQKIVWLQIYATKPLSCITKIYTINIHELYDCTYLLLTSRSCMTAEVQQPTPLSCTLHTKNCRCLLPTVVLSSHHCLLLTPLQHTLRVSASYTPEPDEVNKRIRQR